jgi:hypothetical protein
MGTRSPSDGIRGSKKTGHSDPEFVARCTATMSAVAQCPHEDMPTTFALHGGSSTACCNSDGTFDFQPVTRVGDSDCGLLWLGVCAY